jgi:diguanylate cyclase (GGDEF)-like protein/PAS domain S-box-containing protein
MLVVSAGPFSPVFGSDEMLMLRRYADSLAVAMDRVHLSSSLRRQSQRMESLLRAVSDLGAGLVVIEEGRLTDVNDAYRTITGFAGDELNGRSLRELIHEDDRESLDDHLRDDRSAMGPVRFEVRLFRKDGSTVEAETVLDSFDGESGGTRIALVQDISARKHAERTLADAARLDPLTGLANRRSWQEFIASSLEQAATSMQPLCVALIDLDNFKDYNDDWGHQRGDRLLAEVAEAWKAALREGDFVARYGGDEFAIAMPGCKLDQAESVLQRLLGASPQAASIGLAEWDGAENAEDLVSRADGALLSCKRDRRGAITVVHGTPTGDRFVNWSARLDTVLNGTDLTSAYQPIVELESGDLLGYEALLRVSGSPADSSVEALFSTAQRLGYSRALDWLGRRMAMECAATLPPDALLFVNASARALLDPVHASDQMLMLLRWTQRDAQSVVLELSEREVITDLPRLNEVLAEYRSHGFRFALDDVGEGHSTLEVLAASNPEFIKIAHSLTRSVLERGPRAAVRAIVTFADSTGAIVIAEGVADARSAENMGELGVRFGQGYGLGRPRYFPRHAAEQPALNSA